ncbi:hypothetical protein LOK49_LG14G01789 [Camellia lanceoleosa]|uniref:Uncharacterized protein n=1 Tax=Camellia lanceoleosa TaxID=1840588 RepID=A0ACC0FC19_9ERIC|nr:hypothetical protein LOK49_LG14G01789 [Camellia lanceoleosa]
MTAEYKLANNKNMMMFKSVAKSRNTNIAHKTGNAVSSLADGFQNLQINRPIGPPTSVPNSAGPRPHTPLDNDLAFLFSSIFSFISGASPMTHRGPPPPAILPRPLVPLGGPLQATLPSNLASNRPSISPPGTQFPMPFGSSSPLGSLSSAVSSFVLALSCLRGKWHHR